MQVRARARGSHRAKQEKNGRAELWQEPGEELIAHIVYEDGDEEDLGAEEARACVV